ncbi:MAG TPA: hypothetical protein VH165_30735 [Kofleriaceae bacterium]|nr:hypothetical protein [Kofleriaceae bacterium]
MTFTTISQAKSSTFTQSAAASLLRKESRPEVAFAQLFEAVAVTSVVRLMDRSQTLPQVNDSSVVDVAPSSGDVAHPLARMYSNGTHMVNERTDS